MNNFINKTKLIYNMRQNTTEITDNGLLNIKVPLLFETTQEGYEFRDPSKLRQQLLDGFDTDKTYTLFKTQANPQVHTLLQNATETLGHRGSFSPRLLDHFHSQINKVNGLYLNTWKMLQN